MYSQGRGSPHSNGRLSPTLSKGSPSQLAQLGQLGQLGQFPRESSRARQLSAEGSVDGAMAGVLQDSSEDFGEEGEDRRDEDDSDGHPMGDDDDMQVCALKAGPRERPCERAAARRGRGHREVSKL